MHVCVRVRERRLTYYWSLFVLACLLLSSSRVASIDRRGILLSCLALLRANCTSNSTQVLRKSTAAWILVVFRRPRAIRTTANKVWQTTNRCCCRRKDRPPPPQQTKLKKKETSRVRCRRSPGERHADRKLRVCE